MQLTTSRADIGKKQRPLQRSQLLSDKNIQGSKGQSYSIMENGSNLMKRSCISAMDNTPRATNLSIKSTLNGTPPLHNGGSYHPVSSNYYSSETRTPQPYQLAHHNNPSNQINMRHSHSMIQNNENEYNLPTRNGPGIIEQSSNYQHWISPKEQLKISNQIIQIIKERHLNNWLKPIKQEIIEQVNKVKGELHNMRAQWNMEKNMQGAQQRQMRADIVKMMDSRNTFNPINSKIRKEHELHQLEKQVSLVQERIGQLENKFGDCFNKLLSDFQKTHLSQKIKPGILKSSLPPIILQYRQSFIVQKGSQSTLSSQKQQIIFTSECYHIDKNGFLMDSESRYILDQDNKQIRLDQRQVRLLEEHDILKR